MENSLKPEIHILGMGAIGLLCAMDLKQHGLNPCLLARPGMKTQKNQAVTLVYQNRIHKKNFSVLSSDALQNDIKILIVSVKAHQLISAIAPCINHITSQTVIVLLQNGMGGETCLLQKYPSIVKNQIFHAVNTHAALRYSPFVIEYTGKGNCQIGTLNGLHAGNADSLKKHCLSLLKSSFFSHWNEHIHTLLWQKLIINAAINPITALLQCKNGELLPKDIWVIVTKIIQECCIIAQHNKIPLSPKLMEKKVKQVCISTQNNYSSMAQDLLYYRSTEIDYINGYLLRNSQNCSVYFPYNQMLVNLIKSRKSRKMENHAHKR